jgi:CBS domain-containing protein
MVRESAHRLIVVDSDGKLLRFLTQSAIIRFVGNNKEKFQSLLSKKLSAVGLSKAVNVFTVKSGDKAIEAFKLMSTERVAAVGVVDDEDKLVGNVSSRDLRMIRDDAEFLHRLYIPLSGFLIKSQKQFNSPDHIISVTAESSVEDVVDLVNKHHIHRVYVVAADGSPVRVVSLTDLLEVMTA